ncbi:helix-turn-helix transcriptional regulator [Kutzneria buriramensis]|uniref:Regulatory LuxR family protein n=1 Tax=Kutzneria buriramensis TaxID=1045776 RepID=A0A3E0HBI1_9PSEU|nr:helix-turn-helix transcriptional regulator [Kutzneria buriramensis]REH41783.1 regulatory LuxR family protein [Kutzneria buriramensis]
MPRIGSGVPLVARQAELAALESALAAASEGRAGAVLLAGDAGVGKSRLLAELTARAGVTVLTGRCLDIEGAGLPYLPFVEALGQLPVAGGSRLDDAMEQLRLFEAVYTELAERAADNTVLLALEDLHWADAGTRGLLLFLVSRLSRQRLLIVGTYRLDDLHRRHPLRPLLTELARLSTVERIELRPFDRTDAMAFVAALSDSVLPEATLRSIADRSEGNAFFCEELTAVYGSGTGVPSGLADVLLARVEHLGPNAQRVVRAASGAGGAVEHSVLQAVTEIGDLDEALREAVQHNVLVTADHGYAFRHALLREAVYGDLLPGERARLHGNYARLVTSPASLAYHSLQSNDLPKALTASVQAAEEAAELRAPAEALRHVEQALRLFEAVPDPDVTEYSLQRLASRMALAAGEIERAVAYARAAVALADDPETGAEARHQLVLTLFPMQSESAEIAAAAAEAWDLIKDHPPSVVQAKILALRALEWRWHGGAVLDLDVLERFAVRARDIATRIGAHDIAVDAMVTLSVFTYWHDKPDEALAMLRDTATRAAAVGAYNVELRALANAMILLLDQGRTGPAVAIADEIADRAAAVGLTWSDYAVTSRMVRAEALFHAGELAAGDSDGDHSAAPPRAALIIESAALYRLAIAGRFEEVDAAAARIMTSTDDAVTIERVRLAVAEAALWRGRLREAVDECARTLDWLAELPHPVPIRSRIVGTITLAALADLAEQAWSRRDEEAARDAIAEGERLYESVMAHDTRTLERQWRQEMRSPEAVCMDARMHAELSRLRGESDVEAWRVAVEAGKHTKYWQAVARWRLAEALLAGGWRDEAASELHTAHADAVRCGANPLRAAIESLARRARIAVDGVEPDSDDLLTPRELAVLELVSSGLTNRQIGDRLYISEKTASVHLSRVMAKLGASSRTEAVSLAYERGLLA